MSKYSNQVGDCHLRRVSIMRTALKQVRGFVFRNVFPKLCAAVLIPCLIQTAALAAEKTTPDSEIKAMRFCDVGSDGVCIEGRLFVSGSGVEHSVTVFQQKEDQALLGGGDNLKPHNPIGGNSAENSTKEAREKVVDTHWRDFISTLVGIAIVCVWRGWSSIRWKETGNGQRLT